MSIVRKGYKLLISKKLPNDTIISIEFSTQLEETDVDPVELFERAYQSVMSDLKAAKAKDAIVKSAAEGLVAGITTEQKFSKK
jgi:hypothetical protein